MQRAGFLRKMKSLKDRGVLQRSMVNLIWGILIQMCHQGFLGAGVVTIGQLDLDVNRAGGRCERHRFLLGS